MHLSLWQDFDRALRDWPLSGNKSNQLSTFNPQLDIHETPKEIIINAELPGLKKEDVHLTFNAGYLEIEGEKEEVKKNEDTTCHFSERSYGSFMRRIPLPKGVNDND